MSALVLLMPLLVVVPGSALAGPYTDPNVDKTWERTDLSVANGQIARSWLWGPNTFYAGFEDYAGASGGYGQPAGNRLVFYFDKSRMEINNLNGDRLSKWFITNGLLVKELISGKRATGDFTSTPYLPASQIPVAGDEDPSAQDAAPSYAAFYSVTSFTPGQNASPDRTGQSATLTLDKAGNAGNDLTRTGQVKLTNYDPVFGHNIPQPFWDFMNKQGKVYENGKLVDGPVVDWAYSMGYPIAEAYWTRAMIAGVSRDVLVQPFERRVLTYTPGNPAGWEVEMGNVGRHYYKWRYQTPLPICESSPIRGFGRVWANNPSVQARIGCSYNWAGGEQATNTAVQNFEHGKMIWVDTSPSPQYYPYNGWQKAVYVLFDDGTYTIFQDTWDGSQPVNGALTPPKGLFEPNRGFWKVWRDATGAKVRERLGWATEPIERGGKGAIQGFWNGQMVWIEASNEIMVNYRYYNQNNIYEIYKDDFKS
jgi:hypothetical protein